MSITFQWLDPIRVKKDFGIVDVHLGQTRGYKNSMDALTLKHPREAANIHKAIEMRLREFSTLGTASVPGVPEIAVITYATPKGKRTCIITSCLVWTGAKQQGMPLGKFFTVISLPDEAPDVLGHIGIEKALERMLEADVSV
jgi:hypothetical protein